MSSRKIILPSLACNESSRKPWLPIIFFSRGKRKKLKISITNPRFFSSRYKWKYYYRGSFERRKRKKERKEDEFVGRPALKLITFQPRVLSGLVITWAGGVATIRRVPMVWFRVTGRYRTVGHRKYKTWPLRTFQRAFYALAQGRDCTGYPNTNSIPMLVVDRLLLRDWPTDIGICATVNQRVAAPLKHQYQKEYSISKVAANYWDYTHDWNCGILLFPNGWGEFRISSSFEMLVVAWRHWNYQFYLVGKGYTRWRIIFTIFSIFKYVNCGKNSFGKFFLN